MSPKKSPTPGQRGRAGSCAVGGGANRQHWKDSPTPDLVQGLAQLNGWQRCDAFDLEDISRQGTKCALRNAHLVLTHAVFYRRRGIATAVVAEPHQRQRLWLWHWVTAGREIAAAYRLDYRLTPYRGALAVLVRPGTEVVWPYPLIDNRRRDHG